MNKKTLIAALTASTILATSAQASIKQGGTVTVPIITTGFVENFNPYTNNFVLGVMFEPLFVFNSMTGKIDYRLAESTGFSDDLKTITITLKQGLEWSDGSPLTAKDVAFSFMLTKNAQAFDTKGIWSNNNLQRVTVKDDRTVEFTLEKADSTFLLNVPAYHIVPEKIWSSVKDLTTFTNPTPIGSGPMTTIKYVKSQQMELCRNPNYYLENRPYLDCINFRSYNDNSQIQPALIKGEIDWGSNFIADVESTFVGKDKENHHFWYPPNDAIHLYINTKKEPFNDLRVRQALSMSLDRDAIVDIAAYGYPTANFNVGGIAELYKNDIDKDVNKKYGYLTQYNVKNATALLDEAGIVDRNGDGLRDKKDGKTFEFDIEVVNGWTDWIQTVQMVSEYYAEIGVKANVKTVDWGVYAGNLRDSKYDVSISWSMVSSDPILAFQEYYLSERVGVTWHTSHGINSPEIDTLINSFGETNDLKKQKTIISDLQEFTAQNMPFIPLFSNATWFQYNTSEIVGWPSEENPYIQPVWYDGGNRVVILNNLHLK